MKKIITLLLALTMIFAIVGCSSEENKEDDVDIYIDASDTTSSGTTSSGTTSLGTTSSDTTSSGTTSSGRSAEKKSDASTGVTGEIKNGGSYSSKATDTETSGDAGYESETIGGDAGYKSEAIGGDAGYTIDEAKADAVYKKEAALAEASREKWAGGPAYEESEAYSTDEYLGPSAMSDPYGSIAIDDPHEPIVIDDPYEPIVIDDPYLGYQISSGLLTAGEWNDNKNFYFIQNLLNNGQSYNYSEFFKKWGLAPFTRIVVKCTASGAPAAGAHVTVTTASGSAIYEGVTDHEGMCYVYYSLLDTNAAPARVTVNYESAKQVSDITPIQLTGEENVEFTFADQSQKTKKLDLMLTIDTTGSMGDEIRYLQKELENVITRVQNDCGNIPVRLSVNFYRDHGDAYVVKPYEFTTDINSALASLAREYADGGGDYEEAVELALANSVDEHDWEEDSVKLLFLVLDAPPHNNEANCKSLQRSIMNASEKGIRIIPVASSGVDKDTEFLLRAFAMTTGGTYTFLTDDSGIGGSHIEPTVGDYEVEHLNDMLVRIIKEYIG
ncbi:MAG: VWA domain-containing protein [Lachnospiraceae bacterium]|nr:VWA domain-containing protein [Lachnospiraceae bacterium]